MAPSTPALSYTGLFVLQALAQGYRFGFDIMDVTGLPSGTIYPALRRLEALGARPLRLGEGRDGAQGRTAAPALLRNHRRSAARQLAEAETRYPRGRTPVPETEHDMTRVLLRLISLLVPHVGRPRWREEWLAELDHAHSHGRASGRDCLAMAAGAMPDALRDAPRRLKTAATAGPRAGVFHALDQDVRTRCAGS